MDAMLAKAADMCALDAFTACVVLFPVRSTCADGELVMKRIRVVEDRCLALNLSMDMKFVVTFVVDEEHASDNRSKSQEARLLLSKAMPQSEWTAEKLSVAYTEKRYQRGLDAVDKLMEEFTLFILDLSRYPQDPGEMDAMLAKAADMCALDAFTACVVLFPVRSTCADGELVMKRIRVVEDRCLALNLSMDMKFVVTFVVDEEHASDNRSKSQEARLLLSKAMPQSEWQKTAIA
ncbi:unnamed protein product, partial [Durusdinium trenchii]